MRLRIFIQIHRRSLFKCDMHIIDSQTPRRESILMNNLGKYIELQLELSSIEFFIFVFLLLILSHAVNKQCDQIYISTNIYRIYIYQTRKKSMRRMA